MELACPNKFRAAHPLIKAGVSHKDSLTFSIRIAKNSDTRDPDPLHKHDPLNFLVEFLLSDLLHYRSYKEHLCCFVQTFYIIALEVSAFMTFCSFTDIFIALGL